MSRAIDGAVLTEWISGECKSPSCPKNESAFGMRIMKHIDRMPTIEPEPKWIPCSDAPDTDRNVFIARGERDNMSVCIGHYSNEYKQWYEDKNWFGMLLYDGLYWCEIPTLPEPYREEGDG